MVARKRHGLRGLNEAAHALGVFFNIHICLLPSPARFAAPDQIAVTDPPCRAGSSCSQIWCMACRPSRHDRPMIILPHKQKRRRFLPAASNVSNCRPISLSTTAQAPARALRRTQPRHRMAVCRLAAVGADARTARTPRAARGSGLGAASFSSACAARPAGDSASNGGCRARPHATGICGCAASGAAPAPRCAGLLAALIALVGGALATLAMAAIGRAGRRRAGRRRSRLSRRRCRGCRPFPWFSATSAGVPSMTGCGPAP